MARKITLDFLKTEAASGAFLGFAAIVALLVANSVWADQYFAFLKGSQTLQLGPLVLTMALSAVHSAPVQGAERFGVFRM